MSDYDEILEGSFPVVDSNVKFDFWACQRPLTHTWASGQVLERIEKSFGKVDSLFGYTDGPHDGQTLIDFKTGHDWKKLTFKDNTFNFGFWDPPYDKLYRPEGMEIWRTVRRIAILHTHIWPRAWLANSIREAMIAVTMGPMKQIRCVQVFRKAFL